MINFGLVILWTTACTSLPDEYKNSTTLTAKDLVDGRIILGRPIIPDDFPDIDVMALSEEMEVFLQENVLRANGLDSRARLLSKALFDEDKLNLQYDATQTFTAQEVFERSSANCLGFSLLYTALARRIGLVTNFQEVFKIPEWDSINDEIYIQSRHINIHLEIYKVGIYDVDIDRIALNRSIDKKELSENHVVGLYYGNIASELLMKENFEEAFKYYAKAMELAPLDGDLWTNLGVLYRRAGFNEYAERAYFQALEVDMRNHAAMNNLSYLYQKTGDASRAKYYAKLAKTSQSKNPYFRYAQAQILMEKMQYEVALDHIQYAINVKKDEVRFYTLQSEIYTRLGKKSKAAKAQLKAQNILSKAL